MPRTNRKHPQPAYRSHGVAAVECAVCLPVILVLAVASIECCNMIFVRQSLAIVAYEGVKMAIQADGTTSTVHHRCQEVITERGLHGTTIHISPSSFATDPRGTPVTVTASAPCSANAILPLRFFSGVLTASASMVREHDP